MTIKEINTRFRAYQLESAGSSFSYATDDKFTLIEARITDKNRPSISEELAIFEKKYIDELHITSWDQDHCTLSDLTEILETLKPSKIQYPGYDPHNKNAQDCKSKIIEYKNSTKLAGNGKSIKIVSVTPNYIDSLDAAKKLRYQNLLCSPKHIMAGSNDNSTVKIFREGAFNVASLGDVEDERIGARLRRLAVFSREVDIIILAHHGADCATNSKKFFQQTNPKVVVCSSNYDNEYEHPRQEVTARLRELNIPIVTTKRGDVIIETVKENPAYFSVENLCANSTKTDSNRRYPIKKHRLLSMRPDAFRTTFAPKPAYRNIKK